jgi:prophage DNA circulation protein
MSGILGNINSALGTVNRTTQAVGALATSIDRFGQTAQNIGNAFAPDNSGNSWAGGGWWQQLQPGSWRGCGFVLDAGETRAGRRIAIHEYPYRDDAWAEDLGKLPRRFSVQAYITGDDVYQQRDAMLRAVEQSGPGTLIHPTLGSVQCVLLEFACADRRERGRYIELQFTFILAGDVQYPSTSIATGSAVLNAATNLTTASASDLAGTLRQIVSVPQAAIATVQQFTGMASAAVADASRIVGSVRGLQGFFGRYATGSRATMLPATATVSSVLGAVTTTRTAVDSAANLVNLTASLL